MDTVQEDDGSTESRKLEDLASFLKQRAIGVVVAIVLLNMLWLFIELFDGGSSRGIADNHWPSHGETWSAFLELWRGAFLGTTLMRHTTATLVRVIVPLVIGGLLGGTIGVAIGARSGVREYFDPFVSFLRLLAAAAILPFAILLFGIGDTPLVFTSSFVLTWVIADGVASALAASEPAAVPGRLTQLARQALLISWLFVSFSELIGAREGLGGAIFSARPFSRTDIMVALALWSTLLFLIIDYVIRFLGRLFR